jgi:ribosomal protein S18 acetylase RimI-like enzyme
MPTPAAARTDVIIRRATPDDIPVLGRLGALLVETHHEFDPKRFIPATPQTRWGYGRFLGTQIDEPDATVLAAELHGEGEGQVVGYAYASVEDWDYMALRGPAGVLHDVVVDPDHRGRGIGRMLLDAALVFLKDHGAPRVVLFTAERNEPAQRLFSSANFRRTMIEMTREMDSEGAS